MLHDLFSVSSLPPVRRRIFALYILRASPQAIKNVVFYTVPRKELIA